MITSLADELKRLTVPQTSLLVHTKKKPSLLFDPKDAAGFDRETFYEIGLTGFEELKKLNPRFEEFGSTLFNPSSQGLERSVESHKTNKELNKTIKRFLLRLSPYFLLRPAHQALEWLINRFRVHEYNKEELLLLILPYHETNMFVKVLQLLDLEDAAGPWHWLRPLQRPGVPLSRAALVSRCVADVHFLRLVCEGVRAAAAELGEDAPALATAFAFLCSTLVGVLESSPRVTEAQLTALLPTLTRGLSSAVPDFALACFMVVAQLASKASLAQEVLHPIVTRVAKTQTDTLKTFPSKALIHLSYQSWFPVAVGQMVTAGGNVTPLLKPLVTAALDAVRADSEEAESIKSFIESIVTNVSLDETDIELIVRTVVNSVDVNKALQEAAAKDIWTLDGNGDMQWYSRLLKQVERQYPEPYDKAMKKLLMKKKNKSKLQVILDFCDTGGMLDRLNHPVTEVRQQAVESVVKNFKKFKGPEKQSLKHTLSERLRDDDLALVDSLLGLGLRALLTVVDPDYLLETLVSLAVRTWQSSDQPPGVAARVLRMLCSFRVDEPGLAEARTLLALLPYLLPVAPDDLPFVAIILESKFAASNKFLRRVSEELSPRAGMLSVESVCDVVWKHLHAPLLPDVATLSGALDTIPHNGADVSRHLLSVILMANAVPKDDAKTSLEILNNSIKIVEESRMYVEQAFAFLDGRSFPLVLLAAKEGSFAVQAFIYCLISLTRNMSVPLHLKETQWWTLSGKTDHAAAFFVRMFEVLVTGCNLDNNDMKKLYVEGMKVFFKIHFPLTQLQVQFLSKLAVGGDLGDDSQVVNPELQVNALRLAAGLVARHRGGGSCKGLLKWSNALVPSLVVALASPLGPVRRAALDCAALVARSRRPGDPDGKWEHLVRALLSFQEEITMDRDQLTKAMQAFLDKTPNSEHQVKTLQTLLGIIVDAKTPDFVSSVLLGTLENISSEDMLVSLVPLGRKVLSRPSRGGLGVHGSAILRRVLAKLGPDTGGVLQDPRCWGLVEAALADGGTRVWGEDGSPTVPAVLVLRQISVDFFASLKSELQRKIFDLLVTLSTSTDQTAVLQAINHVVKVIILDASLLLPHLVGMKNAGVTEMQITGTKTNSKRPRRTMNPAPSPLLLQSEAWKKGVTVLEFIQNKKKLHSSHLILPVLFDILKKALELEEQAPVEYVKQLLLSCVLHCLEKLPPPGPGVSQPERAFNVELVIRCVRSTQNPQTQHHALLLLSHLAEVLPEQVLHNMMSIFTFIGYSVLRLDDAYSFQIITKILDSVIPILIKADDGGRPGSVVGVLRVFADALLDVPAHRRMPVYQKLLCTVDPRWSLWQFLCLVLESHVLKGDPGKARPDGDPVPMRVDFCLEFTLTFPPPVVVETCIRVVDYIVSLPASKDTKNSRSAGLALFDIEQHSPKQLRHFRYALSSFLVNLLSSTVLINKIASLGDDEISEMEPLYTSAIETVLGLIKSMAREADRSVNSPNLKYWKIMLNQSYEILNKVNGLLPGDLFAGVVRSLLGSEQAAVRRRAAELLNRRLQHQAGFYAGRPELLAPLLAPLWAALEGLGQPGARDAEAELGQQTALLSLKLLARLLAPGGPQHFLPLLNRVTDLVTSGLPQGNVLGSVVLLLAELTSVLQSPAIASLPEFMPALIKLLRKQRDVDSPNMLVVSVVTAVYKIVETLAKFMSPYLDKLLMEICVLSGKWQEESDALLTAVVQKLRSTRQNISTCIPPRVLVPAVARCHARLLEWREYAAVGPLMGVLAESFSAMPPAELARHQPDLTAFFQRALQFRSDCEDVHLDDVSLVEGHCVDALMALILKLSESYFRPLYYGLYHWATSTESHKDRTITFYRVSDSIAEKLKGLCVLFAGHFLKNAADLLVANNAAKTESLHFGSGEEALKRSELLLEYILKTLHKVFLYDSQKFINKERFDTLMQPIVDQLENTLNGLDSMTSRATTLVVPCITQLAVAVADDALWKDLIYQVLLKMRHNTPEVRLAALKALCEVVRALGDAFMPFLPETVPFLAELLEDEHEGVEAGARRAVQDMEELIGEPLQKYF
ncbi:HEAT repeat-containing protein 1 isoform X2 [Bacillus rossius redtenbacheri]|uniref:HEAT repeat-containing protein 1 isoform X2 n=1 Tax=Bacillus rossius redtenbacheri TaxID=93214 RepID=UPI002FDE8957